MFCILALIEKPGSQPGFQGNQITICRLNRIKEFSQRFIDAITMGDAELWLKKKGRTELVEQMKMQLKLVLILSQKDMRVEENVLFLVNYCL
jgi:hypothetical protein